MQRQFVQAAERAKHDLGKYIAFQTRWLPSEASKEDWQEGLVSDLLQTRRGPAGTEDAVAVWRRLRLGFAGMEAEPEVVAVDQAIAEIDGRLEDLASGRLSLDELQGLAETAKAIASHLATLHKRLRGA